MVKKPAQLCLSSWSTALGPLSPSQAGLATHSSPHYKGSAVTRTELTELGVGGALNLRFTTWPISQHFRPHNQRIRSEHLDGDLGLCSLLYVPLPLLQVVQLLTEGGNPVPNPRDKSHFVSEFELLQA